jgi:hypothetical protein
MSWMQGPTEGNQTAGEELHVDELPALAQSEYSEEGIGGSRGPVPEGCASGDMRPLEATGEQKWALEAWTGSWPLSQRRSDTTRNVESAWNPPDLRSKVPMPREGLTSREGKNGAGQLPRARSIVNIITGGLGERFGPRRANSEHWRSDRPREGERMRGGPSGGAEAVRDAPTLRGNYVAPLSEGIQEGSECAFCDQLLSEGGEHAAVSRPDVVLEMARLVGGLGGLESANQVHALDSSSEDGLVFKKMF